MYTEIRTITIHTNIPAVIERPRHHRKARKETVHPIPLILGTIILTTLLAFLPQPKNHARSYQRQTMAAAAGLSAVIKPGPCVVPDAAAETPVYTEYEVPAAETGFKTYMSCKAITNTASDQWAMQQDAWTDELGFRRYGDLYMVAMGTYYGAECGNKFHITMESGAEFDVITGDVKADRDTDALNQHRDGNVLEFIVDSQRIPEICRFTGNMSNASDLFTGKIASIRSFEAR